MISNKEIQEKRMCRYFIDATKNIIKSEGISTVSVRSIAREAGYSYATMYHYFKDVNDLLFLCIEEFQHEIEDYVLSKTELIESKKIEAVTKAYIEFFTEYPGIFELFFLAKPFNLGNKQAIMDLIDNSLIEVLKRCAPEEFIELKDKTSSINRLKYSVIGLLLMYLNRNRPVDYRDFCENVNKICL